MVPLHSTNPASFIRFFKIFFNNPFNIKWNKPNAVFTEPFSHDYVFVLGVNFLGFTQGLSSSASRGYREDHDKQHLWIPAGDVHLTRSFDVSRRIKSLCSTPFISLKVYKTIFLVCSTSSKYACLPNLQLPQVLFISSVMPPIVEVSVNNVNNNNLGL